MTMHCPDCHAPIPARKRNQDGRCWWCRLLLAERRKPVQRPAVRGGEWIDRCLTGETTRDTR